MKFEYTDKGLLKKLTNQFDQTKELRYNIYGQPTLIKEFDGVITRIYYDKEKQVPTKIRDAEDNTTLLYHNENNELIKTISPNGAETAYEYNQKGELMSIINPLKGKTTLEYDEHYGRIIKHTKESEVETLNPYGYTGREIETNELYYYRARYYDAGTQRFLSVDPIGFVSGDFNFYRYVGNGAVNRRDPFGMNEEDTSVLQWVRNKILEKGNRAENKYSTLRFFNNIARTIVGKESKYHTKVLGMSVDAGAGLAVGRIEGGVFIGMEPMKNGKGIQKVCRTYVSFEYRGVLSKGALKSMSQLGQGKTREPEVSSAVTFINGTEPPSTVLSSEYRSITNFFGPFASTTFYTDPDGDGIFDYEISNSVDVQFAGDWDYGTSMTYGHGEIYENTCEF